MDGPTLIVGTHGWVRQMREYLALERVALEEQLFHEAVYGREAPTHFVETLDGQLGYGHSFAEAFSHLIAQQ